MASGSDDQTVKLWSVETGQSVKTFSGHQKAVGSVAFSPDGKYLATGSEDKTIKLWSLETDYVECLSRIYPYSLGELLNAGIELEPNDTTAAKQDTFRIAERTRQDKKDYDAAIAAWQATPQYKTEKTLLDSLAKVDAEKEKAAEAERLANMDIVDKLNEQIQNSEDTVLIYQLLGELIDTLEKRFKVDTSYREQLARACDNRARHDLFLKKFKEAEQLARRGLKIMPDYNGLKKELGHALLLQGKYDEALKVYQDYADDPPQYRVRTNVDALLKDFDDLEEAGITHKDIEKVKKTLSF